MILHENSKGVRLIREDKVKRSTVKAVGPVNNAIHTYRFNNLPFYSHPLLSWANLDCCGVWAFDKDYLYTAVQDGKKPVADISATALPEILPAPDYDVWYDPVATTNGPYTYHHMLIARRGCLSDFFNLQEIVAAYARQGVRAKKDEIQRYFSTPLIDLFQDKFWVNPQTDTELIVTGLGLGYPIESTASIICGY